MSVEENLEPRLLSAGGAPPPPASLDHVYGLFPILRDKCRQPAGELSGGQQRWWRSAAR
jgi:branched-chain amino acid transport system ATP-binding protein